MKKLSYLGAAFALPFLAFAQVNNLTGASNIILNIINNVLVPIIFGFAFIIFIWGIFRFFIQGAHDEEKRENGRNLMLWGLVGFFAMVSVWGLLHIIVGTFNLNPAVPSYPTAPYTTNGA